MIFIVCIVICLLLLAVTSNKSGFYKSEYSKETNNKFKKVQSDKGLSGEYLAFKELEKLGGYKRILANVYVPKNDKEYSEIDIILVHEKGIYVIESKNYSGWIWGDMEYNYWIQTFKDGNKRRFYNPILQNKYHINNLKRFLNFKLKEDEIRYSLDYFKSIVVFSNRCTFKDIDMPFQDSGDIFLIKRDELYKVIRKSIRKNQKILSKEEIDLIYEKLSSCTKVSKKVQKKHIKNIKNKYN